MKPSIRRSTLAYARFAIALLIWAISALTVLPASAQERREPALGTWLMYHSNYPRVLTTISRSGSDLIITTEDSFSGTQTTPLINAYDNPSYNLCVVPSQTVIARLTYQGLDQEGQRMYTGSLLGATVTSDGTKCSLIPVNSSAERVGALLQPSDDPTQKPPLMLGPVNALNIFPWDHWNNGRPNYAATFNFTRTSYSTPIPTKGSVEAGLWQNAPRNPFISFDVPGGQDWGGRVIRNLWLHNVTLRCSTWSLKQQKWVNPAIQSENVMFMAAVPGFIDIKDDGTFSAAYRMSSSPGGYPRYHSAWIQGEFPTWSRATGKLYYAEFMNTGRGATIEQQTHGRFFDPEKPGINVKKCEVTTTFTAFYGY